MARHSRGRRPSLSLRARDAGVRSPAFDRKPCNSLSMPSATPPRDVAQLIGRRDRAFLSLIEEVGPPPARRGAPTAQRFPTLIRTITHQLLATRAAATIHGRVHALCHEDISVESILAVGAEALRSAGLNRTKALAMIELAEHVREGRVQLDRHGRMSDDDIVRDLTVVRGIGPWTAHMYLMHTLGRADVWPVGDYGVRNGWSVVHAMDETIGATALREQGGCFAGHRSSVAWYCWRAVDLQRAAK